MGMAMERGRGYEHKRNSWWFLLKDSVIFVLIMCMLQVLHVHLLPNVIIVKATQTTTTTTTMTKIPGKTNDSQLISSVANITENFLIKTKEIELDPKLYATNMHLMSNQQNQLQQQIENNLLDTNLANLNNNNKNDSSKSSSNNKNNYNNSINLSKSMKNNNDNIRNSGETVKKNLKDSHNAYDLKSNYNKKILAATENFIRENVVLPSKDPEREAQLLYEQSLKDYHEDSQVEMLSNFSVAEKKKNYNQTVSNNTVDQHSLQSVCHFWTVRHCECTGTLQRLVLSCRGIGILAVPIELPGSVVQLDIGNNNISQLPANTFFMVPNLEELTLSDNKLINIDPHAFYGLSKLKRLNLQNCGLTTLPDNVFQGLPHLLSLQLNSNAFESLGSKSLLHIENLRTLRLEGNSLTHIPTDALAGLKALEALNLGSNSLTIINDADFPKLPNLVVLLLKRNQIMKITAGAFSQLTALKVLELDDNLINTLPKGLNKLTQLQEFSIANNRLRWINETDLPKNIHTLVFKSNPLSFIANSSLQGMLRLRKLILSDVRTLRALPEFEGCYSLEILKVDRAGILDVPANLCQQLPRLKSLELKKNSLMRIPNLGHCRELRLLDLSNNYIETLHGRPFLGLTELLDLVLSYNNIKSIPQDAFFGIPRLQLLDLEGNEIHYIHKDAFTHFNSLEDLNLGNNIFPELPSSGLHRLLHLKTFNNPKLREFPTPETFPRIQTLILSYAYHCCPFMPLVAMSANNKKTQLIQEAVLFPTDSEFDINLWNNSSLDVWPYLHNFSKKFNHNMKDMWNNLGLDFNYPMGMPPNYVEEYPEEDNVGTTTLATAISSKFTHMGTGLFAGMTMQPEDMPPGSVQCLPMPGPFLPCGDLFDWWTLRCGVWVVFLLALLGNGTVVVVLIFSRSKMDVPRFLVSNLAAADFFMGIYLGILAMVDASTLGEFRMFAIPWQMSVVCQLAGFLAVLSSELSVYTLAVITLERNYAITHAIHLNKRLSLRKAGYIMLMGWIFAIVMAILPLVGVSDYRKFAVCLPFETTTSLASLSYVVALMFINGCAFLTLMGCYLKMYWAIRGSQAWNSNDSRIAKRMALLVFTDFLCWSPIAFFSLTAIFGLQLISLEQAKIFTVFILPLNSCCNPFMYAIMTKQFKKDCVNLCKNLEETRVARTATGNARRGGERALKNVPTLMPAPHPPGCRCLRMMPSEMPNWHKMQEKTSQGLWARSWHNFSKICLRRRHNRQRRKHNAHNTDPYKYQFAEIKKQKKQTRASSISSENFCSSRSSSWRNGPPSVDTPAFNSAHHTCSIPMKHMGDPNRRRHSAWLITRKTSQDSNLSSSRNDSSASATTASTSTFRLSRSSAGSSTPLPPANAHGSKQLLQFSTLPKPRLVRQEAVQEEEDSSPPRLGVRFLPTIPSAADSSIVMDDADSLLSAGSIMGLQKANTPSFFALMQSNTNNNSNNNRTCLQTANPNPTDNCTPQKGEINKHPP